MECGEVGRLDDPATGANPGQRVKHGNFGRSSMSNRSSVLSCGVCTKPDIYRAGTGRMGFGTKIGGDEQSSVTYFFASIFSFKNLTYHPI
jgi:hypothetical protein